MKIAFYIAKQLIETTCFFMRIKKGFHILPEAAGVTGRLQSDEERALL
jgi:hypothetical protein